MHADGTSDHLVVYTSIRGLLGAVVSPLVLLGLGFAALAGGGPALLPVSLVVVGAALGAVTLLDYPRRAVFGPDGVTRVCVARRQHLPWSRLVAIDRTRPSTAASVRNLVDRDGPALVSGGLVARGSGRRRWLLTDRIESNLEYDRIEALLGRFGVATQLRAARPHDGVAPTNLYRRSS